MLNRHNHSTLFGHRVQGTTLALTSPSLGLRHPGEDTFSNSHSAIDATLSLRSASPLPSHIQDFREPSHFVSHQHVGETRYRSSCPITPDGLHMQSTPNFHHEYKKTVNLNIIMGHNSSVHINVLNNKPCCRLVRDNIFAASSNIPSVRSNLYGPGSSHPHHPYIILNSNQETITNRSYSRYASPIVGTMSRASLRTQENSATIPCLRQNTITLSPHQRRPSNLNQSIPCENQAFSQSSNHPPSLLSSTPNPTKNQELTPRGCTLHDNSLYTQSNLPTSLGNHPVTKEVNGIQQAFEPDFNHHPLPQTDLYQVISQSVNSNATNDLDTRAKKCHHSPMRLKSHPYIKYGPYTCPRCHETFENGYRFAAHVQRHYKDETPTERKKRREHKIRSRDLHIAQSMNGITIMPGSPAQLQEKSDGNVEKNNNGEDFSSLIIKKEQI